MEDTDYIGDYSSALGITLSKLNEKPEVGMLSGIILTNGAVLEMRDMVVKLKQPMSVFVRWVIKILQQNNVDVSNIKEKSLLLKSNAMKNTRQGLRKSKADSVRRRLEVFLSEKFVLPVRNQVKKGVKRRIDNLNMISCKECDKQHSVNQKLADEIKVLEKKVTQLTKQLEKKPKVIVKKVGGCQRLNQTIKRKNNTIQSLKCVVHQMKKKRNLAQMKPAEEQLMKLKAKISTVKKQKRCLTRRSKKRIEKLESQVEKGATFLKLEREKCKKLQDDNIKLNEEVAEFSVLVIETKKDGKTFNSSVRRAVYFCLEQEVPASNISAVLHFAVTELAGGNIRVLPDTVTCLRMLREMRELARIQMSEVLKTAKYTTLKYDGTTKKRSHYLEVQVADEQNTYTAGISILPSGTASANFQGIMHTIHDLGAASEATTGTDSSQTILDSISNTMTDRCIVNKAVNRELKESMSEGKQQLNEFFCAMHPLDTFAKSSDKEISKWEEENLSQEHKSMSDRRRSLSGAQSFITAVCRLCFNVGSGLPSEIYVFLKDRGIKVNNILSPVIGSRFHILYRNAGAVCFLTPHIQEFFTKVWPPTNDLHRAVLTDSKIPQYQTGCRALGIIGKYVSGPWMSFVEKGQRILELNKPFMQAVEKMERWKLDPSPLVNGNETSSLFEEVPLNRDAVFTCLTTPHEDDVQVTGLLVLLLDVVLQVCRRQLKDQLHGGIHSEPTEELVKEAASCVGNNISGERIFGLLDHYIKRAPNSSLSYIESKIMYKVNNTTKWLSTKSCEEQEELLATTRKLCLRSKQIDAERRYSVMEAKKLHLETKRQELVTKDDRTIKAL